MPAYRFAAGRAQNPLTPLGPNNFFVRKVGSLAVAESQTPALKVANQLSYNNPGYSYNGEPPPKFYGYEGTGHTTEGRVAKAEISQYTMGIWVVPAGQPTQKLTFVNEKGEARPPGESHNLQSFFEAVPMPEVSKVPAARLVPEKGSDGLMCVWQPSTGKMWEIWRLAGKEGEYTFQYGGFQENVDEWTGVCSYAWGPMATSLAMIGGLITLQDLVEVLQGKPIKHALIVYLPSTTAEGPIAPATRQDKKEALPETYGGKANPAYGGVDAVAEASWLRFPPSSTPSEYGITRPLETAIFAAIRDYGLFVGNSSGATNFYIEWPGVLGSPYSWARVNPLAGSLFNVGSYPWIPPSWTDPTLPPLSEELRGPTSCFAKQPWQTLELLAPRES